MKVVFLEDVEGTAQVGDVKDVKNGFARNFLLPRNIAVPATKDNLQRANSLAQKEARRQEKLDAEARGKVGSLEGYKVTLEARVGETGRLFGSITNRDIAEKLHEGAQVQIDSHLILLAEPIRELGTREVMVKFTRNVSVPIQVEVVPDEASKPIVERLEAEAAAQREAEEKAAAAAAYSQGNRGQQKSLVEQAMEREAAQNPTAESADSPEPVASAAPVADSDDDAGKPA